MCMCVVNEVIVCIRNVPIFSSDWFLFLVIGDFESVLKSYS